MSNKVYGGLPEIKRINVRGVFLDAALCYEFGGDYKLIFTKAYNSNNGHSKKMFGIMMKATPKQMDNFCKDLIS